MKNKDKILFAIYKNGNHLGNEKGKNKMDAIKKYLIASSYKESLNDIEFLSQYSAIVAIKQIHFFLIN